ncbi:hypothetical protein [Flavobacterium sp. C4GT6]|uniref:hypothetical protein n=1 Tax=Flavobacterium sp. C4GT6 TaxID=3103818 RepID=UPI002ED644B0
MKKALRLFILLWGLSCFSQTGIGTVVPHESAVLDLSATDKVLLLSRVDNTGSITNPENGMVIYDKTDKCIKVYQDNAWSGCIYILPGSVTGLDCTAVSDYGELREGEPAVNVYSVISYTGGDDAYHNGQTVTSTGVTGLTATLAAGSFVNGSGSLTYTITGTPSSNGTASFAVNIGGQSCTLTRTVLPIITLAQNRTYIVASVYDQDYLPYTAPVGPATTAVQAADGSNETVTLNIQGSITTAGVAVKIPVTATGSGTLAAYSTTITIPAGMTEDGVSRDLTLSWAEQGYTLSTTAITATIAAVGGTLNAKKLDVNAGIGNDGLGVLMGNFIYPYNSAGDITNYEVRNVSAIPDKMFGLPDNTGSTTSHQMLYLPVVAEDGNIWLNNNLGAHYANLNHADFNPLQQATSATDHLAYGSKFQWGRKADGHELITYTSGTAGTPVNGTTTTKSDTPTHALFIRSPASPYDWRATPDDTLWATESSTNNPCPVGFRVPTLGELTTLVTTANITNDVTAANSVLKFTVPGYRDGGNGALGRVGSRGGYWSSSVGGIFASVRNFNSGGTITNYSPRPVGWTVRCLKD